ncbi:MAG TPA: translocation/assembly module TamB domain-containing protein [Patescibacteria group bacterium]|nr:translocation/assembly module TamB domain-containing protein [Patescibacteria group bacterium]
MKVFNKLQIFLTGLIFFVAATCLWLYFNPLLTDTVRETLISEVSRSLGCRVEIGDMEFDGPTAILARHVRIFDKQGETLLDGEQVRISYQLNDLLWGKASIASIRHVDVKTPRLFLRQRSGQHWNIEDLEQATTGDQGRFTGTVKVTDAFLNVQMEQETLFFEQGSAEADFSAVSAVLFRADWRHQGALVQGEGQISVRDGEKETVRVRAEEIQPARYQALIAAALGTGTVKWQLVEGTARNLDVTARRDREKWQYSGEVTLDGLGLDVDGLALRQFQGDIAFDNRYFYVKRLQGKAAGQPVSLQGRLAMGTVDPAARLTLSSQAFHPAAVISGCPLSDPIAFQLQLAYADRQLYLQEGVVRLLDGEMHGTGQLNLDDGNYRLKLNGKQINLGKVPQLPLPITGKTEFELTAVGIANSWPASEVVGSLKASGGDLSGVPYRSITAAGRIRNGQAALEYGILQLEQGVVTAFGTLENDQIQGQVTGQGMELAALAPMWGNALPGLTGKIDFSGPVHGPVSHPEATLELTVTDGRLQEQAWGRLKGTLDITPEQITVRQMLVEGSVARHTVTGKIQLDSANTLDLKISSHKARAELFMKILAPDQPLTGYVDNELEIRGPMANCTIKGQVRLSAGSYGGHLIEEIRGTYWREQGKTFLRDFTLKTMNATVRFGGEVAADNSLNMVVVARNFTLDQFPAQLKLPFALRGRADFNGTVAGTLDNPSIIGDLAASRLFLNGQEISVLQANFSLQNRQLSISQFDFAEGVGSYSFTGGGDLDTGTLFGKLKVTNGSLLGLMGIAKIQEKRIQGQINGEMVLEGTVQNPAVRFTGQIDGTKVRNYSLNIVNFDLELRDRTVTVHEFVARQPGDGIVAARGTAMLDGKIDLEVGGRDVDASLFNVVVDSALEAKGKISFTIQASGETSNPHIATSLAIHGGSLGSASFDDLFGLFVLHDNIINVNQLYLSKGEYKASAYGTVPLRALNPQGRQQAGPADTMNLTLLLDHANLSILPLLTDQVDWAVGPTTGEVQVTGTVLKPLFEGKFTVDNGTVKLHMLPDPVEKMSVDVRFERDTVTIRSCEGKLGGGTYTLNGSLQLDGLAFSRYDLKLVANKLGIRHKYLAGPVDGILTLTGSGDRPVLGGKISIENTVIDIPGIPDSPDTALNVGLDLELTIGKKVRFYNPYFYDFIAEGKIKLSGTTQDPKGSGRVEVVRGNIRYLTNRFNIVSGRLEFSRYDFIKPVIQLTAETRVGQTIVELNASGPVDQLDLKLTSSPSMSQQDIMMLLTTRNSNGGLAGVGMDFGREKMLGLLNSGLQLRIVSQMENSLRDVLGVDEVRFTRTGSSFFDSRLRQNTTKNSDVIDTGYRMEIVKYLSDRMSIMYTRGLDQGYNIIDFRYELNKNISIGGSFISNGDNTVGSGSRGMFTIETRRRF